MSGILSALFLLALFEQHAAAAAVAVDRNAFAAALPRRAVDIRHERFRHVVRQVDRYGDRVVDPFLDRPLHLDLGHPVDVVGRRSVVGRRRDPSRQLLVRDRAEFRGVVTVGFEPLHEIMVVDVVLLELLARLVRIIHVRILIRRIDLAAAFVHGPEDGLDARRGLRHERRGARRRDGQHGDVAAAVLRHFVVQLRIGLPDAEDHRIGGLLRGVVNGEGAALAGHADRSAIGGQRQRLLHLHGESGRLGRTVTQSQRGEHVAFGRDAEPRAAALAGHRADLLPQAQLHAADVLILRIVGNLVDDQFDLLQFEVDDVVHHAHRLVRVDPELVEIELRLRSEGRVHIAQQIEGQQAARIVGTERNLAARVGRDRREAFVGIAVGDAFAEDRIPEEHARLGRFPCVVDDLVPELSGVYVLLVHRLVRHDRELLAVGLAGERRTHEFVVDLDRDVGARNLARVDLGVDETLGIGMFDREREHERAATPVLRHLARRIGVTLHEGDDARRGEGRVEHGAARGADVREVVADAAAAFHQLHLLLVHAEDAAVGIGRMLVPDHEAVRQRGHLKAVADARHGAALRDDVAEMIEQFEHFVAGHRVGIIAFDAFDLGSDALVHLARRRFVDVPERILERILAHPDRSGEFVAAEIGFRLGDRIVVGDLARFFGLCVF